MNRLDVNPWIQWAQELFRAVINAGAEILAALLLFVIGRQVLNRSIRAAAGSIMARYKGDEITRQRARVETLTGILHSVATYVLAFIAGIMILRAIGLDPSGILATAGVLGLAVGFGAQKLLKDVITGFFILVENQFAVGDYVTIGSFSGRVVEMGMRVTRLEDEVGRLIVLANGDIASVVNHSFGPLRSCVEISVKRDVALQQVESALGIGNPHPDSWVEPPVVEGITALDANRMTVRLCVRAVPGKGREAELFLRAYARERLAAANVELA